MLEALCRDHRGRTSCFYLDVSWEETLRRHETRPQRSRFDPDEMRQWYVRQDLLPDDRETVIDESATLDETVRTIVRDARLPARRPGRPAPVTFT